MDALGLGISGIDLAMASIVYSGYVASQNAATISIDWDVGVLCGAGHWQYVYIGSPILFIAGSTVRVPVVPLTGDAISEHSSYLIFTVNSKKQSFTVASNLSTRDGEWPTVSFYLMKYN